MRLGMSACWSSALWAGRRWPCVFGTVVPTDRAEARLADVARPVRRNKVAPSDSWRIGRNRLRAHRINHMPGDRIIAQGDEAYLPRTDTDPGRMTNPKKLRA